MISVCIPTFNGEKYIKEQLESILCQLSELDEVIISDDSSTDKTLAIIEKFKDNKIKVLSKNKFKSPIFNLENALKHAKGDFIFLSDQDDIWMPDKVKKFKSELLHNDLCVSDCMIIDAFGNIIEKSFFETQKSDYGFWKNLIKNTYIGCCMAFRKDILTYILPFPSNIPMHDSWIGLNVELRGKVLFMNERLVMYRRHSLNVSQTANLNGSKFSLRHKLYYRMVLFFLLIFRYFKII